MTIQAYEWLQTYHTLRSQYYHIASTSLPSYRMLNAQNIENTHYFLFNRSTFTQIIVDTLHMYVICSWHTHNFKTMIWTIWNAVVIKLLCFKFQNLSFCRIWSKFSTVSNSMLDDSYMIVPWLLTRLHMCCLSLQRQPFKYLQSFIPEIAQNRKSAKILLFSKWLVRQLSNIEIDPYIFHTMCTHNDKLLDG